MEDFVIGIDLGTSGVRAIAVDVRANLLGTGHAPLPATRITGRRREQNPADWWDALTRAMRQLNEQVPVSRARAIAIDGTSGTILPINSDHQPLAPARMYDDADTDGQAELIAGLAPRESAAHGASSPVARARDWIGLPGLSAVVHQADWIVRHISGHAQTDENNALKTGYDPVARKWPAWIEAYGIPLNLLPKVVPVGTPLGSVGRTPGAAELGLDPRCLVVAGTTDGCATFLASGAAQSGEASTALGSTLVLKMLSDRPVFAPEYGIYSHRIGDQWLAGGASNCGGRTLLAHFTAEELRELDPQLHPDQPTGLDYYPLPAPGERFPIADSRLEPRLTPRPPENTRFLQGMLEGLCAVEKLGYDRLSELGAPRLRSVRHAGGGARSESWMRLRARALGVPLAAAWSEEAAAGAARLAWQGLNWKLEV